MSGLPILTYHSLDDSGRVTSTRPSWFLATMSALHSEGFRCVRLSEWVEAGRPDVERGFALAFDDGLASIRLAADVLSKFDFAATAFLVSGRMGQTSDWDGTSSAEPILNWSELGDLRESGFDFGAHSLTHPRLGCCDPGRIAREVEESGREIEDRTGEACLLFAYPFGDAPRAARELVGRHFSAGFTTRLDQASGREALPAISRIDAYYLRSPRRLRAMLSGRWMRELQALRTARAVRRGIAVVGSVLRGYSSRAASVTAGGA